MTRYLYEHHEQLLSNLLLSVNIERFSYDLEMKTRKQNRNNKRTEIERFDWFIERIQTRVAFRFDVILQQRLANRTMPSPY